MRALSIRQPFAELILRGVKTVEYRSRPTRIIEEPFWIYASRGRSQKPEARSQKPEARSQTWDLREIVSDNLAAEAPPPWIVELAEQLRLIEPGALLPTGVIVGTARIARCERSNGHFAWHLQNVKRLHRPRRPKNMPQPVWFNPF